MINNDKTLAVICLLCFSYITLPFTTGTSDLRSKLYKHTTLVNFKKLYTYTTTKANYTNNVLNSNLLCIANTNNHNFNKLGYTLSHTELTLQNLSKIIFVIKPHVKIVLESAEQKAFHSLVSQISLALKKSVHLEKHVYSRHAVVFIDFESPKSSQSISTSAAYISISVFVVLVIVIGFVFYHYKKGSIKKANEELSVGVVEENNSIIVQPFSETELDNLSEQRNGFLTEVFPEFSSEFKLDTPLRFSWPTSNFQKTSLVSVTICSLLCCSLALGVSNLCLDLNFDAEIHISLPVIHSLKSIEFYLENTASQIDTLRWSNPGRRSNLKLFDVDSIGRSVGDFQCDRRKECQVASQQGLLGCHPASGACICVRGFRFLQEKGACIDINECSSKSPPCSPYADCVNLVGSFLCKCKPGYFGTGKKCNRCSTHCPSGQYITSKCSRSSDIQCQVCDECQRGFYEAEQCLPKVNRRCIHAARPLLSRDVPLADEDFRPLKTSGISDYIVHHSSNVFPQSLGDASQRHIQVFISSNGFAKQFLWPCANPKIRVNVSLSKINLVPRYKDIYRTTPGPTGEPQDASDNNYAMKYFHKIKDERSKDAFNLIRAKYCRQPVPDYYMIHLLKHKDIVSKVIRISCAKKDRHSSTSYRCPPEYGPEEFYYHRVITSPCAEQIPLYMTYKRLGLGNPWNAGKNQIGYSLQHTSNVFFCGQTTDLLRDIFNMTSYEELTLPTFKETAVKDCQENAAMCFSCFHRKEKECADVQKRRPSNSTRSCCNALDCYEKSYCIKYYKKKCVTAEPTCGKGEVNRFSLVPTFPGISSKKKTFQCHLKYVKPDILYAVSYHLEILDNGKKIWESAKKSYNARAVNASFHRSGVVTLGPLRITHDTAVNLPEDYILLGNLSHPESPGLQVRRLKSEVSPLNRTIDVISPMTGGLFYIANVQVKKPFAVSSSTWINHNCYLNTSLLMANTTIYAESPDEIHVSSNSPYKQGNAIVYDLQSELLHMNFSILDGESLLRYNFCENRSLSKNHLLGSPKGQLFKLRRNVWAILVTGFVADVPAYLSVKVKDIATRSLLFSEEWLILREHNFTVNFTFPLSSASKDVDIEVDVDDCLERSRIYLTQIWRNVSSSEDQLSDRKSPSRLASAGSSSPNAVMMTLVLCLIIGFIYLLLLVIFALTRACRRQKRPAAPPTVSLTGNAIPVKRKAVIITYIGFRVFYNFLFTFSVVISLILTLQSAQVNRLDDLPAQMDKVMDNFKAEVDNIERLSVNEESRQLNYINKMRQACDQLLSTGFQVVSKSMNERTNANIQTLMTSSDSIAGLLKEKFILKYNAHSKLLDKYIDSELEALTNYLDYKYSHYSRQLKNTYNNKWLNFPLSIFNKSHFFVDSLYDLAKRPSLLRKRDVDFMTFLEDTNAEELHLLPTIIWKKFDQLLPDYHTFSFDVDLSSKKSLVFVDSPEPRPTSFRYFSSNDDSKYELNSLEWTGQAGSAPLYTTESRITLENQPHARKRVSHSFSLLKLRLILLVVDILILVYRFYHTYLTVRTLWIGKPILVDNLPNPSPHIEMQPVNKNSGFTERRQLQSSCSWKKTCVLGNHYLSVITGLMTVFILICIVLVSNKNSMATFLITSDRSETKILRNLAHQWSKVNENLARVLNGPAFLGAFKFQSSLQVSSLLQLVSRFNYDQNHLKNLYIEQSCPLSDRRPCELSGQKKFVPISYDDQVCNYLSLKNQNISVSVLEDTSTLHRVVDDCHSIISTACLVVIAVLLLAACSHVIGMLFLKFVNTPERRYVHLQKPPRYFDTFGRRIPQTPPAQPPDRVRRTNSIERLATHIEESNV